MKNIGAKELNRLLTSQEVFLIDVRENFEYVSGYIKGAHLIPLSSLSKQSIAKFDKPLAIYCKLGRRSQNACLKLLAEDSSLDLYSLDGGIEAWKQDGYEVIKSSNIISVERQTQIAIGFMLVLGLALGKFISPAWLLLPAFLGFGLIVSGILGICGLAKLIALMPWNNNK